MIGNPFNYFFYYPKLKAKGVKYTVDRVAGIPDPCLLHAFYFFYDVLKNLNIQILT